MSNSKQKNIQKVVFCLDNNKFYLLSNGGTLPSDKFVVLFDEEKYGYKIPDALTAELMKNVLLTRFSEGKFGIFLVMIFINLFSNITNVVIRRVPIWIWTKETLGQP